MTVNEKVAYIKGLMEGLDFKPDTSEKKILSLVVDLLADMCEADDSISDRMDNLEQYLSELDSDLGDVEELLCDPDPDDDDDDGDDDIDVDDIDDDDDDDNDNVDDIDDEDDNDDDIFEVECPNCGETVYFDSSLLDKKEIRCPACNEKFSFEFNEDESEG